MKRYRILFVLWLFQVVNYIDRTTMSFAGPGIVKSLHLKPQDFGVILSSFALGYFLAQLPGGLLADRFGSKAVLVVAPLFWALFTGWVGLAASLTSFIVLRFCFGLAEGVSNPAVFKVIADVFEPRERVQASALWATSLALAPAFGGPLIGLLFTMYGWRVMFVVLAVPALAMAGVCWLAVPRSHAAPSTAAIDATKAGGDVQVSFRSALRRPALWVTLLAYFGFNIAFFGYLGWMPSYLAAARGIDLRHVGFLAGLPFVFAAIGLLISGRLASGALYPYRCLVLAVSHVLASGFLVFAYQATTLAASLAGLSGAAFFLYMGFAIYAPVALELAPIHGRGLYSSLIASVGQLGGIVAPAAIGYLVAAEGNYAGAFIFMIAVLLAAALGMLVLHPTFRRRPTLSAAPLEALAE